MSEKKEGRAAPHNLDLVADFVNSADLETGRESPAERMRRMHGHGGVPQSQSRLRTSPAPPGGPTSIRSGGQVRVGFATPLSDACRLLRSQISPHQPDLSARLAEPPTPLARRLADGRSLTGAVEILEPKNAAPSSKKIA